MRTKPDSHPYADSELNRLIVIVVMLTLTAILLGFLILSDPSTYHLIHDIPPNMIHSVSKATRSPNHIRILSQEQVAPYTAKPLSHIHLPFSIYLPT